MSLNTILHTAQTGLMASQTALRTVSDNIANVNTPGYVRKTVEQQSAVVGGMGAGVEVTGVRRVFDAYLQKASFTAASDSSRWGVTSDYLDHAQSLFGDPSGDSFFFNRLDDVWASFAAAADDPSSGLLRTQAMTRIEDFLNDAGRIDESLDQLAGTVDSRIEADVDRANQLLLEVNRLNVDISRAQLVHADSSGAENIQTQMLDELSTLINVQVTPRINGGVVVRSVEGTMLAGDGAATLTYEHEDGAPGYISVKSPFSSLTQPTRIESGEIRGLLDLRDRELPALSSQLGEFVSRAVQAINGAHNGATSAPAPGLLSGRNTGLDLPTAVSGFTGVANLAIVNASGVVQRRVDIDFDASTMSVDGGVGVAFTPTNFLANINTALGAFGSVAFNNGALSVAAAGTNGVSFGQDPVAPSMKAGMGFSQFFGLNDLIRTPGFSTYDTGLAAGDPHGFTAGEEITLRLTSGDGRPLREVVVAVPAGTQMSDLLTSLNATSGGVGQYGQFTLNSRGALSFTGAPPQNAVVSVLDDDTQRGSGGPSMSQLFGLGGSRDGFASRFSINSAIRANPTLMGLAKLDLTVTAGQPSLRIGDGRGALDLAAAGDTAIGFNASGDLSAISMTISRYGAEFGGSIGRRAEGAETRKTSADAVQTEADQRRQSVEGVNLDEELVRLTTYQQAYAASARMLQAAKDLYDVLLGMV